MIKLEMKKDAKMCQKSGDFQYRVYKDILSIEDKMQHFMNYLFQNACNKERSLIAFTAISTTITSSYFY